MFGSAKNLLSGIEDIAQSFKNYSLIPSYTELPNATENEGKIVSIGCNLYYACEGEWKKVGADTTAPPENTEIPDCISNLEEYNQYQDYVDNVINSNIDIAFDIGFRNLTVDDFFNNVCLFENNLNVPENLNLITQAPSSNEILTSNHINNKYPEDGSYDVLWTLSMNNSGTISYNTPNGTIKHYRSVPNTVLFESNSGGNMGWVLPEQYTYVKTGQKFQISMWLGADRPTASSWSKFGYSSHPSSWTADYISSVSSNQSGEITIEYSFNKLFTSFAPNWHENNLWLVAVFNYGTEYASWYLLTVATYPNANLLVNMSETAVLDQPLFNSPTDTPTLAPGETLGSVRVIESNYKWALVPKDNSTVNIEADPGKCQFVGWQTSDNSILGNQNDASTTALINQDTSITGVFDCSQ